MLANHKRAGKILEGSKDEELYSHLLQQASPSALTLVTSLHL